MALRPRHLLTALSLTVVTLARSAAADDIEKAKTLFEEGLEKLQAKSYDEACPRFAESQRLDPRPGTLFTLAECEALRGHAAAAYTHYGEYLEVYKALPQDKQSKQGTREKDSSSKRAELAKAIGLVTLTLPEDAPAGTVVTRDGVTLTAAQIGAPIAVDAGEHVITTQAPGGPLNEQRFTIEKGEQSAVSLEVRPAAATGPTATAVTTATPSGGLRRTAMFVSAGVGAAGLIAGAITGGLMLSQIDAINAGCKDGGAGVKLCNAAGAGAGNSAKLFGTIATAGFAAGLAGAGVAVVLFVTRPKPAAPAQGRAGSIEMSVLPLGPLGTTVGVRGSF